MLLDAALPPVSLEKVPQIARAAEELGFDALWSTETMHDPFLPGALIAVNTRQLNFGTSIAD
jgi:alkanesulfonate monooxygenase SsuD/methylene tetrahydromethanopterin reductase-like flavin-dependent oxidoreductase (luciferase family)